MALLHVKRTFRYLSTDVDADFNFQDYQFKNFDSGREKRPMDAKWQVLRKVKNKKRLDIPDLLTDEYYIQIY